MSSVNGMCPHNNQMNYCVSCAMGYTPTRNADFGRMGRGMGVSCPAGFYDLMGLCVPNLGTVTQGVTAGALATVASGASQSAAVQQAATETAGNTLGQKIVGFYQKNPTLALALAGAVVIFTLYGAMNFVRGK